MAAAPRQDHDHDHEHRPQQHRRLQTPSPIPIPSRLHTYPAPFLTPSSGAAAAAAIPFPSTPSVASTPSKRRRPLYSASATSAASFSSLLLLLFSLRSLYSLLPFVRSAPPSFSLFPFSFLVSLLSFLFLLPISVKDLTFAPISMSSPFFRPLASKSAFLALVLLLRFHALRYCAAGAAILADISGALLAKSLSDRPHYGRDGRRRVLGFAALAIAVSLLSYSWDRNGCFPLSSAAPPAEGCARVVPIALPFFAGFLGFYERAAAGSTSLRQLGRRPVRLYSLAFVTAMLFVPACISFFFARGDASDGVVSLGDLGWPLLNTVIFGVILSESYSEDKLVFSAKDFRRDFLVTFFCTLVLELVYFPRLSLPGFVLCGLLLWIAVRELGSSLSYVEIGNIDGSNSLNSLFIKPIRQILSERKSRKIALFLLINTAYMVVEFVAGFMSNSLGLISDACHMLFDCAALAIGLYASYISRLPSNSQYTYGRGRFEVLSGYANAVFLVLVGAMIVLESFERILDPQDITTSSLLIVSIGGLLVNVIGLVFFHEEHHHAHGGVATCSLSHGHAHEEHHHHHHHKHDNSSVGHAHDTIAEGHHGIVVEYASTQGHSHGDSHNDAGHHRSNDNSNSAHEYQGHKHDNCSHSHSDHHCDGHVSNHEVKHHHGHEHADQNCSHEHDHSDHVHGNQLHVGQDLKQLKHAHESAELPVRRHQSLCDEDNSHKQGDKISCSHQEPSELSHASTHICTHSHATELSYLEKPVHVHKHHHIDHNMQGIFLHVLADTMGSVGVVISTLLIKYKGWTVADPVCSIFISVMIIFSVIPLLRNSAEILLQRVPRAHEQDLEVVVDNLIKMKGFRGIQSMHVWNLTNTHIVGTLHLHVSTDTDKSSAARSASKFLQEAGIGDLTIQVECVKD